MPLYSYKCDACGELQEKFRSVNNRRRTPKCSCGGKTTLCFVANTRVDRKNYDHVILSESMGVSPDQVAEHRRRHPSIPMTDTGEIIVENGPSERRIVKELRKAFEPKE